MNSSRIEGFYKFSVEERLEKVGEFANLSDEEKHILKKTGGLPLEIANRMIENVIGTFELPIGIATNFLIDGRDYLVPMVIEEPSVVAAASNAAKMARFKGGFITSSTGPRMIGQIQVVDTNPNLARLKILEHREEIIERANEEDPVLTSLGGGCKEIEARVLSTLKGEMLIVHLIVDVRDAMGANAVNTMAEGVAPLIERITGGKVYLRIISNLAVYRLARAYAVFDKDAIGGDEVVEGVLNAYAFALADPFRCATHNKGIMNGISAVAIATGNDFRALEAGAHAYAALNGYKPLTAYEKDKNGDLVGTIELPIAVGIVGGSISVNPLAKINLKILGVRNADELSRIMAAVGLAQNLAALRALATEGIQRGHMSLHARNIAISAGARGDEVERIVEILVRERKVRVDRAREILEEMRRGELDS
jgi:hydroxymethylglutaryl-CoA reductase